MNHKRFLRILVPAVLVVMLCALIFTTAYYAGLPDRVSQHETVILGQNRFVPGSQAALRVVVRDSKDASPLPDATIDVSMRPAEGGRAVSLFHGRTGELGTAEVAFKVPAEVSGNQTLVIETHSRLGTDIVERPVTVERDFRVYLTTDKPIYQPGQVIHVRALALSTFDLAPAVSQELEITIADGKGNKVFRKMLTTNEFGVSFVDFQLASEVNNGAYKITASLGNSSSEKTVTVEHYMLPKFEVKLETERTYYQPGQHVKGSLSAQYFFGKPASEAQIILEGYTFDVERQSAFNLQGTTDADGHFEFEFDLPAHLTGSDLENGLGRFYLQATVTDQARHSETSNLSLPVAQNALVIAAIPEGGSFRPGLENILYVLTSYPDGTPAETSLTMTNLQTGQAIQGQSGSYGLSEVRFTPDNSYLSIQILAADAHGNSTMRQFDFEGEYAEESVLLRPEKPVYRVGDVMKLSLFTIAPRDTVYLDIVRQGQTVSTRAVEIDQGRADVAVDLTPDLAGTIELHAYKILHSGTIARDTRLVVVDPAEDLSVSLKPELDVYRPGDQGMVAIQVNGKDGAGVQSALGLAIVDESVFALAEQDPGFAKLYFLLENEILTPRYDVHGYSISDLIGSTPDNPKLGDPALQGAVEDAAQASLAAAVQGQTPFSLQANSHDDALRRAGERQQRYFSSISKNIFSVEILLALAILGLCLYAVWREKHLSQSLAVSCGLGFLAVLAFTLWPLEDRSWARTPLDRLGLLISRVSSQDAGWFGLLVLAGLLGYLFLIVVAWRKQDRPLGWALALMPVFWILLFLAIYAVGRAGSDPSEKVVIGLVLGIALLPLSFFIRSAGFAWGRQALPALAALLVALFLLLGTVPILALGAARTAAVGGIAEFAVQRDLRVMEGAQNLVPMALPAAMPTQSPLPAVDDKAAAGSGDNTTAAQPPRLRQYFPETMLWLPDAVTDEQGSLTLNIPVADSITAWRLTALASSQDGHLGSATTGLRVFQDFFVDLDLPLALTVGDEVSIPVGVFNYLSEPQSVRLELEQTGWFELLDEPVKEMTIAANDIDVVYFRVRALQFGSQPFKVTALGMKMSDAIQKEVRVYPNGKELTFTQSDRLTVGTPVLQTVSIPAEAVPGTQKLLVKIYPGVVSQVVEGLDSILRMPYGCFEQTSSTTYPNVLVTDYLKSTKQASPEAQMKAEEYINLGYQRLTTFEVPGGGFSLFGNAPADRMLTAYGLQEFGDMSRVHDVDPALLQRASDWLLSQQAGDGSWENDQGLVHENTWSSLGNDRLPVTAYIVWSLIDAGFADQAGTQKGLDYVRENASQAQDAYVLALVSNALVVADLQAGSQGSVQPGTSAVLDRLAGLAQQQGNGVYWKSGVATFVGAEGQTGSIETTALAALAFLRSGTHADLANAALTYLIQNKDSFGTWYSTQATVLSLKALIQNVRAGAEKVNATVTVSLNGGQSRTLQVTPENFDVVQLVSFDDVNPGRENQVRLNVEGEGNLMYQVTGGYYLPWDKLSLYPQANDVKELVTIGVAYERGELAVNDTLGVDVTLTLNQPGGRAESALIDLGLPPGFTVLTEDLDALLAYYKDVPPDYAFPRIERYELTGRQILVYVSNLSAEHPLEFSYRLRAKFPLAAQAPASSAYDYYNPEVNGQANPQLLVVKP